MLEFSRQLLSGRVKRREGQAKVELVIKRLSIYETSSGSFADFIALCECVLLLHMRDLDFF